ncbi:hypothetical protein DHODJN_00055 [Methylorubrum extorquens]
MNDVQTITGRAVAQVRVVPLAGGEGSHKARQALHPNGDPLFIVADTINPKPHRKSGPKPWSKGKVRSFANLRLSGLSRLIQGRHYGPCDTDDGEAYYLGALPHLVAKSWAYGIEEGRIRSREWAATWTPTLWAEKPAGWFDDQEQRLLGDFDNQDGRPSLPNADEFARALGITAAEVKAYDLYTIGAIDRLEAQRLAEKREADRQYQAVKRTLKGATPRSASISAEKPWLAYGISNRRTWERKVEKGELPPHPAMRPRVVNSSDDVNSSEANGMVPATHAPGLASPVVSECPTADNDDEKMTAAA